MFDASSYSLKKVLNKARELFTPAMQAVTNPVGFGISKIPQAINKITPGGTQAGIQRVKTAFQQNPNQFNLYAQMSQPGFMPIKQLEPLTMATGGFIQNRVIQPALDVPMRVKQTGQGVKQVFTPGQRVEGAKNIAIGGLGILAGITPGIEDIGFATYDALKAKIAGRSGLKAFGGQEYTGLGDAVSLGRETPVSSALNMAELPLLLVAGGLKAKSAKNAKLNIDPTEALKAEAATKTLPMVDQNLHSVQNKVGLGGLETPAIQSQVKQTPNKTVQLKTSKKIIPTRDEVINSIPQRIDNFIQDTLGYSTKAPTGGVKEASGFTKALRLGQEKISSSLEKGLGSDNSLMRNASSTMQGFFRGVAMSPERASASFGLKGEMAVANKRAYDVMDSLYQTIGGNKQSLERINAVLDPAISKVKVKLSDLTPEEKTTYNLIRKGLDLVHDISYANGHISESVYKANIGKYTPRLYDVYELPEEVSTFIRQGKKIATDLYKSKKSIDDWKVENSLNDPVYALGKRLAQVETNKAIKKYTDFLSTQSHLISDVEKLGFIKLSDSPAYGELKGKYVLNSAAEDLKGFFYSNQGMQHLYDAFRAYDRLGIRQLQKKILTVFNPTTNVGNIVSDQVFGFLSGVNPFTLNKNLVYFKQNPKEYKQLADYLMSKGILGNDITRSDFIDKLSSIDALSESKGTRVGVGKIADKIQHFYGATDDVYKTSAFKGLLDKGYSLEEASRKVADSFQNYANVGKFYDTWAKTPVFGSAFIKFQGDLIRIIKSSAVNNPLGLIGFLGVLQGVATLSSKLSGETPEDRATREQRFAAPIIPGLNIPLTWQTPIGEINAARYISPFYANNETTSVLKMLPFVPNIKRDKNGNVDAGVSIAQSAQDPLLSTPVQLLVNRDFRGKNITDPNENKYSPSTLTDQEKLTNQVKFGVGNYLPPTVNSLIDIKSAYQGEPNRYGSMQTVPQAVARVGGIKISQFGPKEAQEQRQKDLKYSQQEKEYINNQVKAVRKELLQGKIAPEVANSRIMELQTQLENSPSYVQSKDAPTGLIDTAETYGKSVITDPLKTIKAVLGGNPIRKVEGGAVILERQEGLGSLDAGNKATQIDHIVPLGLGGTNDKSNLEPLTNEEHAVKSKFDTYLIKEAKAGRISNKKAIELEKDWRNQVGLLPKSTQKEIVNNLGTTYDYIAPNGDYKTIDMSTVLSMPEDTEYQKLLKQKKAFTMVDNILENLPRDQQSQALFILGISPEEATYYNVARQTNDLKSIYAQEELTKLMASGVSKQELYQWLIDNRREVNGKQVLAPGVIDDLVDSNIISYADGVALKKLTVTGTGTTQKKSVKSKKVKIPKPKKITVKSLKPPKVKIIKTASQTFKPPKIRRIKIKKSRNLS